MTAKASAHVLGGALGALAGLHLYWALGGEWGLAGALGRDHVDATNEIRAAAGVVVVVLAVATAGVLARVGVWGGGLPWPLLKWGAWVLAGGLALVAVGNAMSSTSLERVVFAPAALALAVLATLVARSERPDRQGSDGAGRDALAGPSGVPGAGRAGARDGLPREARGA